MTQVVVLVPTKKRPNSLRTALQSVASQTRFPDITLVVREPADEDAKAVDDVVAALSPTVPIKCIANRRSTNLSGAINSGLEELLFRGFSPETTYVGLLDDDDYWDPGYIKTCLEAATNDNSDWIVTGIVRHEDRHGPGVKQSVPSTLSIEDFFVTNPHIQGSNLFLRFSALLFAGGFDESLQSTTDRDVCIRLLDLGVKYSIVNQHLVHHMAIPGTSRLSEPGSEKKQSGMTSFYRKYCPRMTNEQRRLFKKRAADLFQIEIADETPLTRGDECQPVVGERFSRVVPVVAGVMVTRLDSFERLLGDLSRLQSELGILERVVIVDFSDSAQQLKSLVSEKRYALLRTIVKTSDEVFRGCRNGTFGGSIESRNGKGSIAVGRGILHHYLYSETMKIPGSVVWVIDDDVRLERLHDSGLTEPIRAVEVQNEILRLKEAGVSIGTVRCTGDPPLTPLSTARTQILDLVSNLRRTDSNDVREVSAMMQSNALTRDSYPEFYYDYSTLHSGHLEMPIWCRADTKGEILHLTAEKALNILNGTSLSRPIVYKEINNDTSESDGFHPIGVSYFVVNPMCLREFPVLSPRVGATSARRGDTFWGILNRRISGRLVEESKVAVHHVRTGSHVSTDLLTALKSDFVGSSFVHAIDGFYRTKGTRVGTLPYRVGLALSSGEIDEIVGLFVEHLRKRLSQFILNSYRIRGLLHSLRRTDEFQESAGLKRLADELEGILTEQSVRAFVQETESLGIQGIREILRDLKERVKSYRHRLELQYGGSHAAHSKQILSSVFGVTCIQFVGSGHEGCVYSDGQYAYKHLFYGASSLERGQLEFLKSSVLGKNISSNIARLVEILERDGEIVLKAELVQGCEYNGGDAESLMNMVRDCRRAGIVYTNIHPKNLIITEHGTVLCDIGRSLFPLNDKEFKHMAKRAYLTLKFHFRNDLSDIMSDALYDDNLPFLIGFEQFYSALQGSTKSDILDNQIVNIVLDAGPKSVVDFGCGKGGITERIAERVDDVVGYDVDEKIIINNKTHGRRAKYMGPAELDALKDSRKFGFGLCSLVLCALKDEEAFEKVLADLRCLVSDDGRALVVVCNPFFTSVSRSETHVKVDARNDTDYWSKRVYQKRVLETGRIRQDVHRPFGSYEQAFHRHAFEMESLSETRNVDSVRFLPSSEFLLIKLKPLPVPRNHRVSLLIKASPLEWQTIDFQIRHIVSQLEGPQSFIEKIVIADRHPGPFLRQYSEPNQSRFESALNNLVQEGIVDKVVFAPSEPNAVSALYERWFNTKSSETHSHQGQHTYTSLFGFEQCSGDYVLQMDSDCLVWRSDRKHDYLSDMVSVFETDPDALTVSFNVASRENRPYSSELCGKKWRAEVRFSLFRVERLRQALPFPNAVGPDGRLVDSWHRAADKGIASSRWKSYRGGSAKTFYIHVPNTRKADLNDWYNMAKAVERGRIPDSQYGFVDAVGAIGDWIGHREEDVVVIVRGRDVPLPRLRRCLDSLQAQRGVCPGIVLIDAGSKNGIDEYMQSVLMREIGDRSSLLLNWSGLTAMENIVIATRSVCSNSDSIIVHLDADDALITDAALDRIVREHRNGADVTVGSMLRTDKQKEYPVIFNEPRRHRGGNVWQHPRSFRKYLFDRIDIDDFKIDGRWIDVAEDWAFMLPIVEMASNPMMIPDILYLYEPYRPKTKELREYRESVIARIVAKQSYLETKEVD